MGSLAADGCGYYAPDLQDQQDGGRRGIGGVEVCWIFALGCARAWENAGVIWLGEESGYLSDWVTQQWVKMTGVRVRLEESPWLDAPVGRTRAMGKNFFEEYGCCRGPEAVRSGAGG